ncbi:hypothetical protein GCM10007207_24720 [Asaia siamensis]|uniref:Uncharacterized protein n=1 Tax=Asaia siamensis TaxID=110479 RepID=A0ABQ1MC07_9PROT|nr:hypothetical protein AA0323_0350 [Asaia siamensis NRIC 0323]GGC38199.1 hypothetical protein GCM10007207_24720 [Asaia siamensis]
MSGSDGEAAQIISIKIHITLKIVERRRLFCEFFHENTQLYLKKDTYRELICISLQEIELYYFSEIIVIH